MSFRTGRGRAGKGEYSGFVYTSYPSAELFVNGKSYGKQRKLTADESRALEGKDSLGLATSLSLDVDGCSYEPGEVKVVAYDASGKPAEEKTVRTAGKPHHLELVCRPHPCLPMARPGIYQSVSWIRTVTFVRQTAAS